MDTRPIIKTKAETDAERGFSLLETLFALAIMSIASLALFQSTSSMLSLSDRAVRAGERTVNKSLDRLAISGVIDSMIPHWPHQPETAFEGQARALRGLSSAPLSTGQSGGPELVTLALQTANNGQDALTYSGANSDEVWEVMTGLPRGARFEYMGIDQEWYAIWPPENTPVRGYFDDGKLMRTPALPEAVRLRAQGRVIWTSRVSRSTILPPNFDLATGI